MKNAVYLCCVSKVWLDVASSLKKNSSINPAYFISWEKDIRNELFDTSNTFYQCIDDAWKGRGFQVLHKALLDEQDRVTINDHRSIFLYMINRLDPFGIMDDSRKESFFIDLYLKWKAIVEGRGISLVISPSIPHRVFDYALYLVCKSKGITFLMFQMTQFPLYSYIIDDIDSVPVWIKEIPDSAKACDGKLLDIVLESIDKVRKRDYQYAKPEYMVLQEINQSKSYIIRLILKQLIRVNKLFEVANTYRVKPGYQPEDSNYTNLELLIDKIKWHRFKLRLKKKYDMICQERPFSSDCKFVLVALHYQPEETTCPTGGIYFNQMLIIERLNKYLPGDYKILVKEHKSQFNNYLEGEAGRTVGYYDEISRISSRIEFVDVDSDPFKLIDKSAFVVTVSGTIGWEAVLRGRPVIHFGRAWYEGLSGSFRVKTDEDIKNAINMALSFKGFKNDELVNSYHRNLSRFLIRSVHYKIEVKESESVFEESVKNIVEGVKVFFSLKKSKE